MQNERSYSGMLGLWQRLLAALEANQGEIPHLETLRTRFAEAVNGVLALARQQAALTAEKQDVSLQLRSAMTSGQRLATVLRRALQEHYGIRAEKLSEFGLQPYRGRKLTQPAAPPPSPAEPPAVSTGSAE